MLRIPKHRLPLHSLKYCTSNLFAFRIDSLVTRTSSFADVACYVLVVFTQFSKNASYIFRGLCSRSLHRRFGSKSSMILHNASNAHASTARPILQTPSAIVTACQQRLQRHILRRTLRLVIRSAYHALLALHAGLCTYVHARNVRPKSIRLYPLVVGIKYIDWHNLGQEISDGMAFHSAMCFAKSGYGVRTDEITSRIPVDRLQKLRTDFVSAVFIPATIY
jgi:hypothetical protein